MRLDNQILQQDSLHLLASVYAALAATKGIDVSSVALTEEERAIVLMARYDGISSNGGIMHYIDSMKSEEIVALQQVNRAIGATATASAIEKGLALKEKMTIEELAEDFEDDYSDGIYDEIEAVNGMGDGDAEYNHLASKYIRANAERILAE